MAELAQWVVDGEFNGTRSLIIGGSRGLGEITAKILAIGGGDVLITYAKGFADANAVANEINAAGRSRCDVRQIDLSTDELSCLDIDWNSLDAIYFFATPRIFRKKAEAFDAKLFREFCDFYVLKFYSLCAFLDSKLTKGGTRLLFPSTVAIVERPKVLTEYAMAKAAGEILVQEVNRSFKHLSVLCCRLPRLDTDQTATIVNSPAGSNVQTMLPVIRSMQTRELTKAPRGS